MTQPRQAILVQAVVAPSLVGVPAVVAPALVGAAAVVAPAMVGPLDGAMPRKMMKPYALAIPARIAL